MKQLGEGVGRENVWVREGCRRQSREWGHSRTEGVCMCGWVGGDGWSMWKGTTDVKWRVSVEGRVWVGVMARGNHLCGVAQADGFTA